MLIDSYADPWAGVLAAGQPHMDDPVGEARDPGIEIPPQESGEGS